MKHYKYTFIFLLIVASGFGVYYSLQGARYPLAIVNSHIITKREFLNIYQATYNYYYAAAKTYGDVKELASPQNVANLKKDVLEQLIANVLVHDEVKKRLGDSLDGVLANKIKGAVEDKNFQNAAANLYGLTFDEFRNEFLIPMAESEILDGQLFVEKTTVEDWLLTAKAAANVTILDSAFSWSKNGVEVK